MSEQNTETNGHSNEVVIGAVFTARYPFTREFYEKPDFDGEVWGTIREKTWKPGIRCHIYSRSYDGDPLEEMVADGVGEIILRVVGVYKPGRYPTRVFYIRQWRDPDGRLFGKKTCRITPIGTFRRRARGYGVEYRLLPLECDPPTDKAQDKTPPASEASPK